MEVWGSSSGSGRGCSGGMAVSVVGLCPGVAELEVQRGSVLGSSKPLLLLPAAAAAAAAEVEQLVVGAAGGGAAAVAAADALLRDVGAAVAWVDHQQRPLQTLEGNEYGARVVGAGADDGSGGTAAQRGEPGHSSGSGSGSDSDHSDGFRGRLQPLRRAALLPAAHIAQVAQHASAYSGRRGWAALARLLDGAAALAQPTRRHSAEHAAAAAPSAETRLEVAQQRREEEGRTDAGGAGQAVAARQLRVPGRLCDKEKLAAQAARPHAFGWQAGAALLTAAVAAATLAFVFW